MARARAREIAPAAPAPAAGAPGSDKSSGPRSSKGARTRERLVEAAKEVFEELGFLEARISDIAERAGQAHGSFYYYFASKEEVFREVAVAVDKRLYAPLDHVIKAQSKLDAKERVRESMRRYFDSYRQEARILGLIEHVARFDTEVNAIRLARHKLVTERVAETIRHLQRKKLADATLDPLITAAALGALSYRFAELWLVHGAVECTPEHAVEQLTQIFWNALRFKEA